MRTKKRKKEKEYSEDEIFCAMMLHENLVLGEFLSKSDDDLLKELKEMNSNPIVFNDPIWITKPQFWVKYVSCYRACLLRGVIKGQKIPSCFEQTLRYKYETEKARNCQID